MKAKEFDAKFDQGKEDIIDDLDLSKAARPNQEQKRVNVDFPLWMIGSFDREAKRIGVTRQSIIKMWLAERLDAIAESRGAVQEQKADYSKHGKGRTNQRGTDSR